MSEQDTLRVRVWHGYPDSEDRNTDADSWGEPDEVVEVPEGEVYVWQTEPRWRRRIGIDLHPADCPAKLAVFTSDSVHSPPDEGSHHVEKSYWDGPIERGFEYPDDHDLPPFGAEIAGRVAFYVEADSDE